MSGPENTKERSAGMKKTNSGFKVHNVAVIAALLAALLFVGSTFAWYFTAAKLDMGSVSGSVSFLANYFESGDGSAEHPYEIARPEQLYNLAWLQYLGAFNQTSDPEFTPFHFYISDSTGLFSIFVPLSRIYFQRQAINFGVFLT